MEMVLIDDKGAKIHATIRKQLLYVFQKKLAEGDVYKMSFFAVAPTVGSYRTTSHPYKLIFQMKTKVHKIEGSTIPVNGFSLTKIGEVAGHTADQDYLVDVIGLMTGISAEREYVRDGKVTKMIVFELTDDSGKIECALFGSYVDSLQKMMGKTTGGMPVVVVQFAKVKIFRDKASIQNVMNTTRLFVNPPFEEAVKFREGIAVHGVESSAPVASLGPRIRPSFEEDFLRIHPKKTISELDGTGEDGTFIVFAVVDGFVDGQEWWYPACKCHRSVTPDSGAYYCKGCVKHVFHMVPRYKVKLCVSDGGGDAVFVVFDGDMQLLLGVPCSTLVSAAKAENAGFYPTEFIGLSGRKLLFKVEKNSAASVLFDGSFRVKRVCSDPFIIETFLAAGRDKASDTAGSGDVGDAGSGTDEDQDVVDETQQAEDFVSEVIGFPDDVVPVNAEFEDTAVVVEQVMSLAVDGDGGGLGGTNVVGCASLAVGSEVNPKLRSVANVKRNLADAFDEAADGVGDMPPKMIKTDK